MQTIFLDKADLERLAADFNALLHDYPEWRREMYEEMGRAVLEGTFHKMPPREQRKKHKKAEETT